MGAVPSPNTPVHRTATALPVARIGEGRLPALLTPDPAADRRVIEFFTAHIRNPHTRNAYALAAGRNTPSRKAKRPSSRPRKPATCSIPS